MLLSCIAEGAFWEGSSGEFPLGHRAAVAAGRVHGSGAYTRRSDDAESSERRAQLPRQECRTQFSAKGAIPCREPLGEYG
jgi:hypothetical protein